MSMRNSFLRHLALITLLTATLSACEDAPARDARNDPSPSIWAGQALLDDLDIATSLNMLKPDWTPFLGGQLPPRPLRQVISWDSTPHQSPAAGHFFGLDSPPKPCRRPFFRTRLPTKARSEERRVGKECRSRWAADHYKKSKKVHSTA